MKRLALMAAALAAGLLFLILLLAGFGDVPCQDGVWVEARQSCIPG